MGNENRADFDDARLIEGVLAGDERCFAVLHDRYYRRIYRFALQRLSDPCEAEDVAQDVFLEVHRCLAAFEGRSTLLGWMFGIAHNQVCRRYRRRTPTLLDLDGPETSGLCATEPLPDRQVDAKRMLRQCEELLRTSVPPAQREVFQLRYGENQTTRAIAKRLGKSCQAVKISLFRTRRKLIDRAPQVEVVLSA